MTRHVGRGRPEINDGDLIPLSLWTLHLIAGNMGSVELIDAPSRSWEVL